MLNIALVGYGQMGKMLEKIAPLHSCKVVKIFDPHHEEYNEQLSSSSLEGVDVCLDFSLPDQVLKNTKLITEAGKHLVIGTTGWFDDLSTVQHLVRKHDTGLIYAGNFSIGMNLFFLINEFSSKLINETALYDVFGYELHHNKKADSPSGTARELAEIILSGFPEKKRVQFENLNRRIKEEEFHFASVRGGSIPGTHIVGFDSPFDTIELKHTARTREGFAAGAIKAALWISNRKGFFEFKDVFRELIKNQ